MNKREAAIINAFTGINIGDFDDFLAYSEEKFGHPIQGHEMGSKEFWDFLKLRSTDDFLELCSKLTD